MGLGCAGGLLDYDAVLKELDGKIGALGLDVQWSEPFAPDDPVAKHPRQGFPRSHVHETSLASSAF